MFQYVVNLLSSAYVEIAILALLLLYFLTHRRDPRLVVSAIRIVRTIFVVMIFFYFMFIWASTVQPTLRAISVFGMFVINLYMFYNLLLARMERPYREALGLVNRAPEKQEIFRDIWRYGKRFYYLSYTFESLLSGQNPFHFLRNIAIDRVREDIKGTLRHYGVEQKLVSLPMMLGFLKSQLAGNETLPREFKELMEKTIEDFAKHPWIEEQANEFLKMAAERPEDLHFPEWMANFEKSVKT
jgi:hypothetical protein